VVVVVVVVVVEVEVGMVDWADHSVDYYNFVRCTVCMGVYCLFEVSRHEYIDAIYFFYCLVFVFKAFWFHSLSVILEEHIDSFIHTYNTKQQQNEV